MNFAQLRKQAALPADFAQLRYCRILPELSTEMTKIAALSHRAPDTILNNLLIEALDARAKKATKHTPNLNGFPTRRGTIKT